MPAAIFFSHSRTINTPTALSDLPSVVLRLVPLIVAHIKLKYLAKSAYERKAAWAPGDFDYVSGVPQQLLVVLLGLVYATVAPIILPFVVLYFGLSFVVYRYQLLYVYMPEVQTGGRIWPVMFGRIMLGRGVFFSKYCVCLWCKCSFFSSTLHLCVCLLLISPLLFKGCVVYEITMLGVFIIFKGAIQAPLMIPVSLFVILVFSQGDDDYYYH